MQTTPHEPPGSPDFAMPPFAMQPHEPSDLAMPSFAIQPHEPPDLAMPSFAMRPHEPPDFAMPSFAMQPHEPPDLAMPSFTMHPLEPPPFAMPQPAQCVFCDMLAGSVDMALIEDTPQTIAIVNQRQFEHGQALVIPKRHAPTILDLTDAEADALMRAARRLCAAMVAAYAPDGITLYQNNGTASGQEVPHFHMHVVPRRNGSNWGDGPPHIAAIEPPTRDIPTRDIPTQDILRKAHVGIGRQREIASELASELRKAL